MAGILGSREAGRVHSVEAVIQLLNNGLYTVHTYEVIYGLALLKMGIMVPETC